MISSRSLSLPQRQKGAGRMYFDLLSWNVLRHLRRCCERKDHLLSSTSSLSPIFHSNSCFCCALIWASRKTTHLFDEEKNRNEKWATENRDVKRDVCSRQTSQFLLSSALKATRTWRGWAENCASSWILFFKREDEEEMNLISFWSSSDERRPDTRGWKEFLHEDKYLRQRGRERDCTRDQALPFLSLSLGDEQRRSGFSPFIIGLEEMCLMSFFSLSLSSSCGRDRRRILVKITGPSICFLSWKTRERERERRRERDERKRINRLTREP